MLKVWGRKTSVNVQRVMWAVGELGLAHERIDAGGPFGGLDTSEFGRLNPNRLVPTIQDGTFSMWESNAIVRYLAASYGRGSLAPSDAKACAKADQWMDWGLTTLNGDIIATCFFQLIRTPAADRNAAGVAAAAKRAGEKLAILDAELSGRPFILGDTLTMADIAVGSFMYRYFNLAIERPTLAGVEAWYQRLQSRPAYREHVMVDFTAMKVPGA
ncbi:MAG: glutathione S-transferase N-terminal domain-containing protein [Hyphomicrobiaceae bacterium]